MNRSRVSTAGLDAGERRIAARHLLISPILTAARQPAELDLVRRHAAALKSMFASQLGWHDHLRRPQSVDFEHRGEYARAAGTHTSRS